MPSDALNRLVLLTGPSGAGRSTALNALEDLGFETIDNLPLALAPTLLDGGLARDMALGIDVRTRDFSPAALTALLANIANLTGQSAELVVLEAEAGVLANRYNETRRRHPLSPDGTPETGIAKELELLVPLRDQATVLIDTSALSPHDLRAEMQRIFGRSGSHDLAISVQSFSYKRGLPLAADVVFDCRFLKNPHWQPDLRPLTGQDSRVAEHIATDPRFAVFRDKVFDLLIFQLPAARDEGKAHFTVAFGCSGGKHRSVALAESIARGLATAGWRVSIRHRELERRALAPLDPVHR
ncbi:RNase adapter RapZ [Marinovum sp.]|uniref:RNase adapter RapZ n=1 Tax=Marinovum sp. TaxID=2024839 RepID=UPI003A8CF030